MRKNGIVAQVALVALILLMASAMSCTPTAQLDAETHEGVLKEAASVIRERYADPRIGEAIADTLETCLEHDKAGVSMTDEDFIRVVMRVIRSMVADNHFDFSLRDGQKDAFGGMANCERSLHGLRAGRVLENNTAYLEFDGLPGDSASMAVVTQALSEQPAMQALILDLRDNNGGAGDMVVLLCSHLLEADVLLCTFSDRSAGPPMEIKTTPPTRHFGTAMPVFVLTSKYTLSAAEALAYILQDYGRAVVVGEQTAGMANPSRTYQIGERYELTVPFLITRYGRSGQTFAGVGVTPDIEVPAESALVVALEEIRKMLGSSDR